MEMHGNDRILHAKNYEIKCKGSSVYIYKYQYFYHVTVIKNYDYIIKSPTLKAMPHEHDKYRREIVA